MAKILSQYRLKDERSLNAFSREVLRVVSKIPLGQTRSYQWVAEQLGRPKAVRAVGQALKRNPFPLIIPCHRVICRDGKLGGYSRGKDKKGRLLKLERTILNLLREKKI